MNKKLKVECVDVLKVIRNGMALNPLECINPINVKIFINNEIVKGGIDRDVVFIPPEMIIVLGDKVVKYRYIWEDEDLMYW